MLFEANFTEVALTALAWSIAALQDVGDPPGAC